uniref:Uncharacterized protein n=1 Tax=Podoviridae sp. ctLPy3 TaxID=2825244 RepID=A0A8S5UWB7_9CAUD|nr:MAG TPA: hypothetical protein [Podoviridae sp. ctLPy3]DAR70412.1 MAG TPA: hypothetical protein [Caudoviricetes sp.]DAU94355.1 MAG TPA: hypothetical protein [Caudoviricetes sp.]
MPNIFFDTYHDYKLSTLLIESRLLSMISY